MFQTGQSALCGLMAHFNNLALWGRLALYFKEWCLYWFWLMPVLFAFVADAAAQFGQGGAENSLCFLLQIHKTQISAVFHDSQEGYLHRIKAPITDCREIFIGPNYILAPLPGVRRLSNMTLTHYLLSPVQQFQQQQLCSRGVVIYSGSILEIQTHDMYPRAKKLIIMWMSTSFRMDRYQEIFFLFVFGQKVGGEREDDLQRRTWTGSLLNGLSLHTQHTVYQLSYHGNPTITDISSTGFKNRAAWSECRHQWNDFLKSQTL